jgi:hyperosmotically inducible periplasmic protein
VKCNKTIQYAASALVMLAAVTVHAQVSAGDAGSAVPENAGGTSKASIRAANRALQIGVLRSFANTRGLDVSNIVVVARSGVVTLGGSVPDANQVELATAIARRVSGVSEVKSNLSVRPEGL